MEAADVPAAVVLWAEKPVTEAHDDTLDTPVEAALPERSWPLEPDEAEMRALIDATIARVIPHILSLHEQPASNNDGATEFARTLDEPLPQQGTPFDELLDFLFDEAIPRSLNTASPGYFAYINGNAVFESALASFINDSVNRYMGVYAAGPVMAKIEANVVEWFAQIIGYPPESGGFLTSGGSLANLTGVVTARRERLPQSFLGGTIYASDQVHHSVVKAAIMAGFPAESVRSLPSDDRYRLRPDTVLDAVQADRDDGWLPFLVVASAGTTNSGAVDPLDDLADLCEREHLWLHVDASYGGFFALTERGNRVLRGLGRADSVVLDPHKSLFVPYGVGSLLVRDGGALRRAHSASADYMPPLQDEPDLVDFCQISPELSREFRGLKVWLPLKRHGIGPYRDALQEKFELTDWITARLREIDDVEIVAEPQLTILAWRLKLPGLSEGELDDLNQRLIARINARRRVYLTDTRLDGCFVIRICVLPLRAHADRMRMAMEDIRAAITEVRAWRCGVD